MVAPSKSPPVKPLVVGLTIVIVLLLAVLGWLLFQQIGWERLEPFPVKQYQEAPGNLLGNRYEIDAQIDSLLYWEEGKGRLIAVRVTGGEGRIPLFVRDGIVDSLHVGQRYRMLVVIRQGGLIEVNRLKKY